MCGAVCGGSAGAIPEGVFAVTIDVVVVVAVVVHVAKCLTVAVPPSARVHRVEKLAYSDELFSQC